jgi:hypothetical protein
MMMIDAQHSRKTLWKVSDLVVNRHVDSRVPGKFNSSTDYRVNIFLFT